MKQLIFYFSEVALLDENMEKLLQQARELKIAEDTSISTEDAEHFEAREIKEQELRESIEETLDSALMKLFENEVALANQMKVARKTCL